MLPTYGIDREGVGVLVAGGYDRPCQGECPARFLGPGLLIDKVLQQPCLIVEDKEPARREERSIKNIDI